MKQSLVSDFNFTRINPDCTLTACLVPLPEIYGRFSGQGLMTRPPIVAHY